LEPGFTSCLQLNEKELHFLNRLDAILTDVEYNDPEVIKEIEDLESEIELEELTNNQLLVLYSATQTAKHSYIYWSENWDKWLELDENSLKSAMSIGGDIVKGDVAGAVGGAVGALAANIIIGPGQVAYGTAVITCGVAGSVGVAVYKLIEWW